MECMESQIQSRYDALDDMLREFYSELDATICSCMAAGVSADQFVMTLPKLETDVDFSCCCTFYIGFKPIN
jgi:hypothetical protein